MSASDFQPRPRAALSNPAVQRPDWTKSGQRRDPKLLWLDKNENTDPIMRSVTARVLSEMDPHSVAIYPDVAPLYATLGKYLGVDPHGIVVASGSDGSSLRFPCVHRAGGHCAFNRADVRDVSGIQRHPSGDCETDALHVGIGRSAPRSCSRDRNHSANAPEADLPSKSRQSYRHRCHTGRPARHRQCRARCRRSHADRRSVPSVLRPYGGSADPRVSQPHRGAHILEGMGTHGSSTRLWRRQRSSSGAPAESPSKL